MASDNIISVDRVIDTLQAYRNYHISIIDEATATLLWQNPRTGAFIYAGRVDLWTGNIEGGIIREHGDER